MSLRIQNNVPFNADRQLTCAEEMMARSTEYQILQQTGMLMLAQANQLPQQVLKLLQG